MITSEEVLSILNKYRDDDVVDIKVVKEMVNKIHDDFENRTCDNCKFYKVEEIDSEDEMRAVMTGCSQFYMETNCAYDFKNFGCNRWERKNG